MIGSQPEDEKSIAIVFFFFCLFVCLFLIAVFFRVFAGSTVAICKDSPDLTS